MSAALLTIRQVAESIGKSDVFVRNLVNSGFLVAKRFPSGVGIGIRPTDLEAWIDSLENVAE